MRFTGSIREATVNRTAGAWFAAFCVEDGEPPPPVKAGPVTGVDVGVGAMATLSDGTVIENPKALAVALERLRRLNQAAARSRNTHSHANRSNWRDRLYDRIRAAHARNINVRNDHHHKATTAIAKSSGRVVVVNLNVAGMMRNRPPGAGDCRCGHGGISGQAGLQMPVVRHRVCGGDRWFPSSRLCAH